MSLEGGRSTGCEGFRRARSRSQGRSLRRISAESEGSGVVSEWGGIWEKGMRGEMESMGSM